ncbi:MAG: chorismate mutase, partial [Bacillota bacterium]|nr:chorismate mutase [Bacillota bacterium]
MDLSDYRNKIDEIDREIVKLFERRMETAEAIANYKKDNNLPILNSSREDQVIKKVKSYLKNPELMEGAEDLYRCIMKISRTYQQKKMSACRTLNIVYSGVPGAYSDIALTEFFDENFENGVNKINVKTFQDVFTYLEDEKINYGVVPIENSSTGGIAEVYDLLRNGNYYIAGEKKIKVSHYLLGIKGTKIEDIKYVYSHPQGLLQCEKFLNNFPNWSIIPYNNTAAAVKLVKEKGDKSFAAIG